MLQISLSQLRKWRMKENQDNGQGPPFKKIGRLVRYPESGLLAYINGQESDY
jgi:Helix-turn-helix domain